MMAYIIDADEYKKTIEGYKPEKATEFHEESIKMANADYHEACKKRFYPEVILLLGGSASAKTEFTESYLKEEKAIIVDSTLSTKSAANAKIWKAQRRHLKVKVIAIIPKDLSKAFTVFLSRDRSLPITVFYQTHLGSRITLKYILENFPEISIEVYETDLTGKGRSRYHQLIFSGRSELAKYIDSLQLSRNQLDSLITP